MTAISSINDIYIQKDSTCHKCNKTFEINSRVYIFACNHVLHKQCYDDVQVNNKRVVHKYSCFKNILAPFVDPFFKNPVKFTLMTLSVASMTLCYQVFTQIGKFVHFECDLNGNQTRTIDYSQLFSEAKACVLLAAMTTQIGESGIMLVKDFYNIYMEYDAPIDTLSKEAIVKNRDEQGTLNRNLFLQVINQIPHAPIHTE